MLDGHKGERSSSLDAMTRSMREFVAKISLSAVSQDRRVLMTTFQRSALALWGTGGSDTRFNAKRDIGNVSSLEGGFHGQRRSIHPEVSDSAA